MAIQIIGMKLSPFVRKAQIFCAEKGIDFEILPGNPFAPDDAFKEISPMLRIPVMRDTDVGTEGADGTIADSSAIVAYLERKFDGPALYPTDDFDYARALMFEEYADTQLAGFVGLGLFRPMVMFPMMMGKDKDFDSARQTLNEKLTPVFAWLNSQIEGRDYFVGDSFGLADIAVITQFINLRHAGGRPSPSEFPALSAWIEKQYQRPSIAPLIAEEEAMLGDFKTSYEDMEAA